jgi:thimet oligopeptidase
MIRMVLLLTAAATAAAFVVVEAELAAPPSPDNTPFYQGITDEASLTRLVEGRLARAQQLLDRLVAVKGRRTVENTLRLYDDIQAEILNADGPNEIAQTLHPDAKVIATAEGLAQRITLFRAGISLNRRVFDALAAIDLTGIPGDARYYLSQELAQFRRQGVQKDEGTRARLLQLREQLVVANQEFMRYQQDPPARQFQVDAVDLEGLPAPFVAAHPPDASGKITLTTQESGPVMSFAKNEDVRRRMYIEGARVYDANLPVLRRILDLRYQIARLAGYSDWASYDFEDKMAATPKNVAAFTDRAVAASAQRVEKEYAAILARKRVDHPGTDALLPWDVGRFRGLLRRESLGIDNPQELRAYLTYDRIRDGMLQVTGDMFGFKFVRVTDVPVWHSSVEVYEVFEEGERVGRIYLDSHPRPLKKVAAGGSVRWGRRGLRGRQLPEIVQRVSIPGGQPGNPGVVTPPNLIVFFHEFGHVLHFLAAARPNWIGTELARDYVEAPSQMLEEWVFDPRVMAVVARHHETGAPIPATLVQRMRRVIEEGRGGNVRHELIGAKLALSLHDRDPKDLDPIEVYREIAKAYLPVRLPDEKILPQGFGFLGRGFNNVSHYNYSWSEVIAKDLFSQFDRSDLLDPKIARHFKKTVLAPGSSRPPADLIQDFLGRPFNLTAWERWLNDETR